MTDIKVYQIDNDVPIPDQVPIRALEVGESIEFSVDRRNQVQSLATRLKQQEGKEFIVKKVSDTECRVWRIK